MPIPKAHEVDLWNLALARVGDARIVPEAAVAVTSITAAAPPVATTAAHGYVDNDRVLLYDQTGGAEVTGRVFLIDSTGGTTFTLVREDGVGNAAATGGYAARLPNTKIVRACFGAWPAVRDEVFRAHPWNSIVRRARLARLQAAKTITGATAASPVVVTAVGHGYSSGDQVLIEDVAGMVELNDRWFSVQVLTVDTFELSGEDGTTHTAYSAGGTAKKALTPLRNDFGYGYRYTIPADCERVLELAEDPLSGWETEGDQVLTDAGITVPIRYAAKVLAPHLFDSQLTNALAARLAAELAIELSDSRTRAEDLRAVYEKMLAEAKRVDGQEQSAQDFVEDDWILARDLGDDAPYVTPRTGGPR